MGEAEGGVGRGEGPRSLTVAALFGGARNGELVRRDDAPCIFRVGGMRRGVVSGWVAACDGGMGRREKVCICGVKRDSTNCFPFRSREWRAEKGDCPELPAELPGWTRRQSAWRRGHFRWRRSAETARMRGHDRAFALGNQRSAVNRPEIGSTAGVIVPRPAALRAPPLPNSTRQTDRTIRYRRQEGGMDS